MTRRYKPCLALLLVAASLFLGSPARGDAGETTSRVRVVVTTSMMGAAVADLAYAWCSPVPLFPATGCPGQFDLTPRAMAAVEEASLVLVHDYQESLRARIAATGKAWRSIPTSGTQTLPGPYLDLCAAVAQALAGAFPGHAVDLQARLNELRGTLPARAEELRRPAESAVQGRPFLVATFQADFVTWVGARPAVVFDRTNEITLRGMDTLVRDSRSAGVRAIIGNEPWGDREVRAFGAALRVPWTILGNYPDEAEPGAWLRLVRANCDRLVELAGRPE